MTSLTCTKDSVEKTKLKVDFSPEAISKEIREEKELCISINSLKRKVLTVKRVSELLRRKENDNDAAILLALMLGFDTILRVMAAMRHVPRMFHYFVDERTTARKDYF